MSPHYEPKSMLKQAKKSLISNALDRKLTGDPKLKKRLLRLHVNSSKYS
jgi:hypothetical protein